MRPSKHPMIPVARPWMDEREADAARRAILSGWVTQGPEVAAFEREFAAAVGAAACLRGVELHDGAAPGAAGLRRRARRRSRDRQPLVRRDRQRHPLLRRDAGLRRRRARYLQHRSRARRRRDLGADQGDSAACTSSACPATSRPSCRSRSRAACRSSRTRRAPSAARSAGRAEWQRIGRPHGEVACFSFHPRKLLSTGDGGMLTTSNAVTGSRSSACCASTA